MTGLLRLDLDDGAKPLPMGLLCWLLRRAGKRVRWLSQTRSPGGRGWHLEIAVHPKPATAMEVVALQAVLGSDPRREACNAHRARQVDAGTVSPFWRERFNVLYG